MLEYWNVGMLEATENCLGLLIWLITAATEESGISLTAETPLLAGNIAALLSSAILAAAISRARGKDEGASDDFSETLAIDNPLTPWMARFEAAIDNDDNDFNNNTDVRFEEEMEMQESHTYWRLPTVAEVTARFRTWSLVSVVVPVALAVLMLLVVPLVISSDRCTLHSSEKLL